MLHFPRPTRTMTKQEMLDQGPCDCTSICRACGVGRTGPKNSRRIRPGDARRRPRSDFDALLDLAVTVSISTRGSMSCWRSARPTLRMAGVRASLSTMLI